MDEMFHQIILDPKVKHSHIVGSGRVVSDFIREKFIKPKELIDMV